MMMKRIISLLSVLILASSCSRNAETILYRIQCFMNVSSGIFRSDSGNTYTISGTLPDGTSPSELKDGRYVTLCNVLSDDGKGNCTAKVLSCYKVLCKDLLKGSEVTDEEKKVSDPVRLDNVDAGQGYINIQTTLLFLPDSETGHLINLVYDDIRSNEDSLFFDIRHNSHGEKPENPELSSKSFSSGVSHASFRYGNLLDGRESVVLCFRWPWYTETETFKSKTFVTCGKYSPEKN